MFYLYIIFPFQCKFQQIYDNQYVEKSLITGILRVAKESTFSGLNNLEVNTILRYSFNDKFGFTETEIDELSKYYNCADNIDSIKEWYNGYIFGGEVIYNPWSVLNYIKSMKEGFMPYWINSSSNDLIKRLLIKGDREIKLDLETLIEGKTIYKKIDDFLKTTIDEGTIAALKQIEDMKYSQELIDRDVKNIIKLAIVFKGKEIKITEGI